MQSGKDDLHSKLFEAHAQICDISRQISANEASYHKQICEGQIEARKKLRDMEKKMKTLDLVLKRKWYDMIASGEKTEEYREIKPYWIRRLCENRYIGCHHPTKVTSHTAIFYSENAHFLKTQIGLGGMAFLNFDKVTFHLGYSKNRPSMTFAIKEIVCDEGKEEWGALPGETYFIIKLGERL